MTAGLHGPWRGVEFGGGLLWALLVSSTLACSVQHAEAVERAEVTVGSGRLVATAAGDVRIHQDDPLMVVRWHEFSVAAERSLTVVQPDTSSVLVIDVADESPCVIEGRLVANGQVVLTNASAVSFGRHAEVEVHSLVVADAHDLTAEPVRPLATVVNRGRIRAEQVELRARSAVENGGLIEVQGGSAELRIDAADGDEEVGVVRHDGVIVAHTRGDETARVVLDGGPRGHVHAAGQILASGDDAGERGGTVHVLGESIELAEAAHIDASGDAGGGEVLIGGGYQGNNARIRNARETLVGSDVVIAADARATDDGGRVIVWAEELARFHGRLTARGGDQNGDGGFVEVSCRERLDYAPAQLDLGAAQGRGGRLLLDPTDIVVSTVDSNSTGFTPPIDNTEAFADDPGLATSLDVATSFLGVGDGATIVLQASDDIVISTAFDVASATGSSDVSLILQAGDDILINAPLTLSGTGDLLFLANSAGGPPSGHGYVEIREPVVVGAGSVGFDGVGVVFDTEFLNPSVTTSGGTIQTINPSIVFNMWGPVGGAVAEAFMDAGDGTIRISASELALGRLITTNASSDAISLSADTITQDIASSIVNVTAPNGGVVVQTAGDFGAADEIMRGSVRALDFDGVVGNVFFHNEGTTVGFDSASSITVDEVTPSVDVTVSLNQVNGPTTVDYGVTGGTATGGGADYTLATGSLSFASGETVKTFSIAITDDGLAEADETLVVTLSDASNAGLGAAELLVTIRDDDGGLGGGDAGALDAGSRDAGLSDASLLDAADDGALPESGVGTDGGPDGPHTGGGCSVGYTRAPGTVWWLFALVPLLVRRKRPGG